MVYLGPANHLRDVEQAIILPPKAELSEGSPGGASCVVMWPLLWIPHLTDPHSGLQCLQKMLPLPRLFLDRSSTPPSSQSPWVLWCSWAVSETTFPKLDELCPDALDQKKSEGWQFGKVRSSFSWV